MAEKIKKNKELVIVAGIGLILTIATLLSLAGMVELPNVVLAATDTATVTVTATVEAWINIDVSTSSTPITPSLVDSTGGTHIGSTTAIDIDVGTNNSAGWTINIKGINDGLIYGATATIASVTATSTLSAGNDGYGANATPTLAGVSIGSYYYHWGTVDVGEIMSGAGQTLATYNATTTLANVVDLQVYAAAVDTKPSGSYTDDIVLTATTNL